MFFWWHSLDRWYLLRYLSRSLSRYLSRDFTKWLILLKFFCLDYFLVFSIKCTKISACKWLVVLDISLRGYGFFFWKKPKIRHSKTFHSANLEAVARRCSVKKAPWKSLQNSNTYIGVSLLIKLQPSGLHLYQKRDLDTGVYLFWKTFNKLFL